MVYADGITATMFWMKGMEYVNRGCNANQTSKNKERFLSHFGTTPGICLYLWQNIYASVSCSTKFFHLLWGLLFLKQYGKESVLSGIVGGVDEKTFRLYSWKVVKCISKLKPRIVSYYNNLFMNVCCSTS